MCADAMMDRIKHTRLSRAIRVATSTAVASSMLGLLSCQANPTSIPEPQPEAGAVDPAADEARCRRFAGNPNDPNLRGIPRTHATRCCPSDYGFDPELARESCGFEHYLGESEELACVHRFRSSDGRVHELRLTPIVDLEFGAAVRLHERGAITQERSGEAPEGLPSVWWSATDDRRWAYVPGWSIVRRLGWDEAACDPQKMRRVLARMLDAPPDPAAEVVLPRPIDEPSDTAHDLPEASLLTREFPERDNDRGYPLPHRAMALVNDLLGAASKNDLSSFADLIEADARIGLPDRRELGARSLFADDSGAAAAELLSTAAARFPADTKLHCPTIDRRARPRVTRGEAQMWCFWMSEDGLDLLAFRLRGRITDGRADARITYIGVFPARPLAPVIMPGEPAPPSVVELPAHGGP